MKFPYDEEIKKTEEVIKHLQEMILNQRAYLASLLIRKSDEKENPRP